MGIPIINVLIKSDRIHRKIPHTGQTVRIQGRQGLFTVMRVDTADRVADVMDRTGSHRMEEKIPFALMQTISENVSQALHQFFESAAGLNGEESHGMGAAG